MGVYIEMAFHSTITNVTIALVLHPHHKLQYFKNARWKDKWIQQAKRIVHEEFNQSYASLDADWAVPAPVKVQVLSQVLVAECIIQFHRLNLWHPRISLTICWPFRPLIALNYVTSLKGFEHRLWACWRCSALVVWTQTHVFLASSDDPWLFNNSRYDFSFSKFSFYWIALSDISWSWTDIQPGTPGTVPCMELTWCPVDTCPFVPQHVELDGICERQWYQSCCGGAWAYWWQTWGRTSIWLGCFVINVVLVIFNPWAIPLRVFVSVKPAETLTLTHEEPVPMVGGMGFHGYGYGYRLRYPRVTCGTL